MDSKADFNIQVIKLDSPVYVAGREVRVKHGTPDCFPAINALITQFLEEDIPSKIQDKIEPLIRFGMCIDHVYYDDIIEFTYITGVRLRGPAEGGSLPEGTKCYTIDAGDYACIKVSSPDADTTIGVAYMRLEDWMHETQEWESVPGEYEVYPNAATNAEMELWRPVRRKL